MNSIKSVFTASAGQSFRASLNESLAEVHAQREEILEAFVAKYGFEPERCVQVHQRLPDGSDEWYLRRRSDEEMRQLSQSSSQL
jgi:hypothetical protein